MDVGERHDRPPESDEPPERPGEGDPAEESAPSAGGSRGLEGGMGISSERTGPDGRDVRGSGVEGIGSRGGSVSGTGGQWPAGEHDRLDVSQQPDAPEPGPEEIVAPGSDLEPGEWVEGIDRTVGESNHAEVRPHPNHEGKNPGHSHG